jgi:hypothetical protein
MNQDEFDGVMLGTLEDNEGNTAIVMAIGKRRCVLTLSRAMLLFEQLGDMLEMLGVIDEDEEDDSEVPRCH